MRGPPLWWVKGVCEDHWAQGLCQRLGEGWGAASGGHTKAARQKNVASTLLTPLDAISFRGVDQMEEGSWGQEKHGRHVGLQRTFQIPK